jgi:hypothetical protein
VSCDQKLKITTGTFEISLSRKRDNSKIKTNF